MDKKMLDVAKWVCKDNKIYFKAYTFIAGTYCYDMETKQLELIEDPRCKYRLTQPAFYKVLEYGDDIIFLPYYTENRILIINIKTLSTSYYQVQGSRYRSGIVIDDKLFAFSEQIYDRTGFLMMDMKTRSISYPFDNAPKIITNQYSDIVCYDNYLYLAVKKADSLLRLNLIDLSYKIIQVSDWGYIYSTMVESNGKMYLSGECDYIVEWNFESDCTRYLLPKNECVGNQLGWKYRFSDSYLVNNIIVFSPLYYRGIVKFNVISKEIKVIQRMSDINTVTWGINRYEDGLYIAEIETPSNICKGYFRCNVSNDDVSYMDMFDLNDFPNIDLCFIGREYSKWALDKFIKNIIKN